MKRIFLLAAFAVLASSAPADAGPIRDRLAKVFRPAPATVVVVKVAPAAPVAKPMPAAKVAAGGKSPACCCAKCECNTAPAGKK